MAGRNGFFEIDIRGLPRLANSLRALSSNMPTVADRAMWRWGEQVRQELLQKPYPPERPGQRTVRTGLLGRSYRKRRVGKLQVEFYNLQKYAGYVVGNTEGHQAWMHAGRWWKARDVVLARLPQWRAIAAQELNAEAARLGLQTR